MLESLDYTIRIGSTPTLLYFDLYLYYAYAAHYVYFKIGFYFSCKPADTIYAYFLPEHSTTVINKY